MTAPGFRPGDRVEESGIYRVSHQEHRADHEVTLFQGDDFPVCVQCGAQVRFHLERAARPIGEDQDFRAKRERRKSAARH